LPSTGVKRAKRTKKANALVTVVTDVTLWTLCGGGAEREWDAGVGLPVRHGRTGLGCRK
jgi:hypothetical protein